jgi:molybdate transport system regulatory protein
MNEDPYTVSTAPRLRLRILFGEDAMLGPGKAELLEGIRETGSIAAAGRRMRMSYKRAWMLVEEMNAAFAAPLVSSARGGQGGGGAHLTETGEEVLRLYRIVEATATQAAAREIKALRALLRHTDSNDVSGEK